MRRETKKDHTSQIGEPPCVVRQSAISDTEFVMIDRIKHQTIYYFWRDLAEDEAIRRNKRYLKSKS